MSKHLGDFDTSAIVYGKFTSFRPSTGAAFTLGGTPALSVYKDNSTTQSSTGVTLTADFDAVTGLNHFAIDTSADGTFYSAGSFFDIVITTGTVDSVSVVGTVVASFTIRKNSALKPTTAGRTLDVSTGGEAGVDWANVGSPTTSLALSGTTVASSGVNTLRKNIARTNYMFKLVDATDLKTAETGITPTCTRSIDGAAFGACTNSATEVANGWYKIDLSTSDLNGDIIVLRFTGAGCHPYEAVLITQPT